MNVIWCVQRPRIQRETVVHTYTYIQLKFRHRALRCHGYLPSHDVQAISDIREVAPRLTQWVLPSLPSKRIYLENVIKRLNCRLQFRRHLDRAHETQYMDAILQKLFPMSTTKNRYEKTRAPTCHGDTYWGTNITQQIILNASMLV